MRFTSLVLLSCLLSVAAFVGQVHGQEQVNACAQACIRRGPGRQCDSLYVQPTPLSESESTQHPGR